MLNRIMAILLCAAVLLPAPAHAKRFGRTMAFGQDTRVEGNQDVSLRAQCIQNENGSGSDVLRVYATTTASRAVLDGINDYLGSGVYLTAATLPVDSELMVVSTETGVELISHGNDEGFVLSLDSLQGLAVTAESSVLGLNVAGRHDCLFSIPVDKVKKFKPARQQ